MKINSLYAVNFRNYESCSLQLSSMINVFYGQNAQGKTNLLEAIFYSAFGMSHRTSAEEEMLKMGADAMAVGVEYASFSGSHEVKSKSTVSMSAGRRKYCSTVRACVPRSITVP